MKKIFLISWLDIIRYDLPRFFGNVWRFRKALWNHYWFDHHGTLLFLQTGVQHMADRTERDGLEIDETRLKKVEQMRRLVQLIKNYNGSLYIELAEAEMGELVLREWQFEPVPDHPGCSRLVDTETDAEKAYNGRIFDRAREIEEEEWVELIKIIKGQDYSKFKKKVDWNSQFDGTGIRGWWD